MKIPKNLNKYQLFSLLGGLVLGLEFLAIILTILDLFYWIILAAYILLGGLLFMLLIFHNHKALKSPALLSAIFISLVAICFFSHSVEPTIFSGRDQGSFSEAAIRLSQNHKLEFQTPASQEFFKIYGPGLALNFPGFSYTKEGNLITQFSLGYTAWLATFYSIFGLFGFAIANGITFFLFLLSFYLLAELHTSSKSAFLAIFLVLSAFVFSWLLKYTLSENLALGLFWFGILELSLFFQFKKSVHFVSALAAFLVLAFTRIEAWEFIIMLVIAFLINQKKHKVDLEKNFSRKICWLAGGFSLIYLLNIRTNNQFYLNSLKGMLRSFSPTESSSVLFSASNYLWNIFSLYNILPFLIISAIALVYFIVKRNYTLLLPAFIILPTLVYLIHPGISLDHPWMLRRFALTIIPGAIFYSVLIVDRLFVRKLFFYSISLILIGTNLLVSAPYFNFRENTALTAQIKALSENFSPNDLVLVDRLASGDGWSMLSGPLNFLNGKRAVYFFNPNDLDKLDLTKFSNVFLIVPDESLAFYQKDNFLEKFSTQKDYSISRTYLDTFDPDEVKNFSITLPQKLEKATTGKIYLLNK